MVPKNIITLKPVTSISRVEGKTKVYIQNVGTGRYLNVPNYNAVAEAGMELWDFHGGDNQEWTITPRTNDNGSTYITISTCQSNSTNTEMVLSVRDALSVINTQMEITAKGNPPSKDQEFYIEEVPNRPGEYYIYSRLTGNYLQLGVYADAPNNGGPVLNKYPYVTWFNYWKLIPVYEVGEDYVFSEGNTNSNNAVKIPSTIDYGVNASYNIQSIQLANTSQYNLDFIELTEQCLDAWEKSTAEITLNIDNMSQNRIIWSDEFAINDNTLSPKLGNTSDNDLYENSGVNQTTEPFDSVDITIYHSVVNYCYNNFNCTFAELWKYALIHELGHSLGLGDMGSITTLTNNGAVADNPNLADSVMVYMTDKVVLEPHEAEIAGVKKSYYKER